MSPRRRRIAPLLGLLGLIGLLGASVADRSAAAEPKPGTPAAPSPLTIEAVRVEPAAPATDTLCHLSVTLKNGGEKTASRLELRVKVNGVELPAYHRLVHLARVPAGGTLDLPLFNFWSTQTGRPAPADGKLTVEVSLAAAAWVLLESANGVETWKPTSSPDSPSQGAVAGLPVSKTLTLTLAGRSAPSPPK